MDGCRRKYWTACTEDTRMWMDMVTDILRESKITFVQRLHGHETGEVFDCLVVQTGGYSWEQTSLEQDFFGFPPWWWSVIISLNQNLELMGKKTLPPSPT